MSDNPFSNAVKRQSTFAYISGLGMKSARKGVNGEASGDVPPMFYEQNLNVNHATATNGNNTVDLSLSFDESQSDS